MTRAEIIEARDEIIRRSGPWRRHDIRLADGVHTIGDGISPETARVRRIVQQVRDLAGGHLRGLRVLDLGAGEGGFAIELGAQEADVVALEGREPLAEKAEFAREVLGLTRVSIVREDVRRLSAERHGFFDVVLALRILEHLDAPAVFELLRRIGSVCKGFALLETRLAATTRATREFEGMIVRGAPRREHATTASRRQRLARLDGSLDNEHGFLLTRPSLLGLIARSGFTTVGEVLAPDGDPEHPCFAAIKGRRVALATMPQANASPPSPWPEPRMAASGKPLTRLLRTRR